jgi:hypothetical protein
MRSYRFNSGLITVCACSLFNKCQQHPGEVLLLAPGIAR